jgi:GDP-mannose 4,6-dehydratase
MPRTALITGITGQDGSYLAELLLEKGYLVHGIKRRASSFNTHRIDHLYQDPHESDPRLVLHYGDLTDGTNLIRIVQQVQPDEIYNLGAQSHVAVSFESPECTAKSEALSTLLDMESGTIQRLVGKARVFTANTVKVLATTMWRSIKQYQTAKTEIDTVQFTKMGWHTQTDSKESIRSSWQILQPHLRHSILVALDR